jgi:hypothetical protein
MLHASTRYKDENPRFDMPWHVATLNKDRAQKNCIPPFKYLLKDLFFKSADKFAEQKILNI